MGRLTYNNVIKYRITVETTSPLHIGGALNGSEDILVDSVTGFPFVQASSIAGMLRSKCETKKNSIVSELFGKSKKSDGGVTGDEADNRGRLAFTDGMITDISKIKYEIRPGISIDRKTGTVKSEYGYGQKYETTYISSKAEFRFYVYLYDNPQNSLQDDFNELLGVLNNGEARIGAKKSSGAGTLIATNIEKTVFNLEDEDSRKIWINEEIAEKEGKIEYEPILKECNTDSSEIKYEVLIKAKTEGPIQVKGVASSEFSKVVPDSENIRNGNEECIIPGSSLRGSFRSRMERIAGYLNKSNVIDDSFGYMDINQHSRSHDGNLIFCDTILENKEEYNANPMRNRIHIDKFTGGIISQEYFKERNAKGEDVNICIQIRNRNNPDATLGLLMYAIRDLAINMFNIGNGYATGKGFLKVSEVKINDDNPIIDFEKGTVNDHEMIKDALKALQEA